MYFSVNFKMIEFDVIQVSGWDLSNSAGWVNAAAAKVSCAMHGNMLAMRTASGHL